MTHNIEIIGCVQNILEKKRKNKLNIKNRQLLIYLLLEIIFNFFLSTLIFL
jgi:hypothetical protein